MERSSEPDAQTEPFAALAAVFVVGLALAVYAGAFEAAVPGAGDRSVAESTADRVERTLSSSGVVDPGTLTGVVRVGPEGYRTNVTLHYGDRAATVGRVAPSTADLATRRVSVRVGFGDVRPGRLEVRVWT